MTHLACNISTVTQLPNRIGWYVDPLSPDRDRYWTGTEWSGEVRSHRRGAMTDFDESAPVLGGQGSRQPAVAPSSGLRTVGIVLSVLAALLVLAGLVTAIFLMTHNADGGCVVFKEFGNSSGCAPVHPYFGAGIGVLVGCLVQGAILGVVGRLCLIVSELRGTVQTQHRPDDNGAIGAVLD